MRPKWSDENNLWNHYYKHPAGRDEGCWSDLLNRNEQRVSKEEYEDEAELVTQRRWLEYTAEFKDREHEILAMRQGEPVPYHELRRHYIDDNLLTTITSFDSRDIVTCYHEHFDLPHVPQSQQDCIGELREDYRLALKDWSKNGRIRKFVEIYNESK